MTKLKTREDVMVDGSDFLQSLTKILPEGVTIKDLTGYFSREFDEPCFKLHSVVLSDDKEIFIEGEHDHPYLADLNLPEGQDELLCDPEDTDEDTDEEDTDDES